MIEMNSCFVFSNSFFARTVLKDLEYLLNKSIDKIYLLRENHSQDEIFYFNHCNYNFKIQLVDTIEEGILQSNIIVISKDDNIPLKYIDYVTLQAQKQKKQCFCINNPWILETTEELGSFEWNKNIPTILIMGVGVSSQLFCMEMLINKILSKNNIRFSQRYSESTKQLLNQLPSKRNLNPNVTYSISDTNNDSQINVITLCLKNEISDIRFNIDNIRRISPDFTVLQTNIDFDQYHVAKGFMEYGGLTMLDVIVKSNYYSSGNYNVLCKLHRESTENVEYLHDNELEKKLEFMIFSKLSLPLNVIRK